MAYEHKTEGYTTLTIVSVPTAPTINSARVFMRVDFLSNKGHMHQKIQRADWLELKLLGRMYSMST